MISIYWRVPARDLLLCNNCFLRDSKSSNQFCKLKRIDTNIEEISNQLTKDEQVISSSSSTTSSTVLKNKRAKPNDTTNKSQISIKISTRQQPTLRSNRKTIAFKAKKVRSKMISSFSLKSLFFFLARKMFISINNF